jgi:C_GCAxxG_C_C family probable redox protein
VSKKEAAQVLFNSGFNCAQAACAPYAEDFGIDQPAALRMAAGFGGGIGRTGETCGAVTGALMVLGMKYGATTGDPAAKERMYLIAQEFLKRFQEKHASLRCRDLVGADINTVEGRASMSARKTHATICSGLIAEATELLDEMLK